MTNACEHLNAYECAACGERRCMRCDELTSTDMVKTAVRWCPAHDEAGRLGKLSWFRTTDK